MKTSLLFTLAVLAGCSTTSTGPIAIGNDTYMVSRKAGAFPSGREPLLAESLAEATAQCASLGKSLKVVSSTEATGPFVLGRYPQATVVFSCL